MQDLDLLDARCAACHKAHSFECMRCGAHQPDYKGRSLDYNEIKSSTQTDTFGEEETDNDWP